MNESIAISGSIRKPLVSVIIPMYNAESTIESAINSVTCDLDDYEIIVIDDGSVDESSNLVKRLQQQDSRIVLLSQENLGVSNARNAGIECARGDWLTFLDADDTFEEHGLSSLLALGGSQSVIKGAFSYTNRLADKGLNSRTISADSAIRLCMSFWDNRNLNPYSSMANGVVFRSACGTIFKTALIRENGIRFKQDIRFGEDALFMVDVYTKIDDLLVVERAVYHYQDNPQSATHSVRDGDVESVGELIDTLYQRQNSNSKWGEFFRQNAARELLTLIARCSQTKDIDMRDDLYALSAKHSVNWACAGYFGHRYSEKLHGEIKNYLTLYLMGRRKVDTVLRLNAMLYRLRSS